MKRPRGRGANGLGTVGRRKDGNYSARLPPDPATGKRVAFVAKTEAEAIRKRDAALQHIKNFGGRASADPTVEAFLREWLEHTAKPRVRASTLVSYRSKVETILIPALGKLKLSKLRPIDVRRMMTGVVAGEWDARKGKRSNRTANYARAVLRKAIDDALHDQVIFGNNAAALADAMPPNSPEMAVLELAELTKLLATLTDHPDRALLIFSAATGVRQGEALGLRWIDLDLEHAPPIAMLRVQLQTVDKKRVLVDLKTKKSRRVLSLEANLVALLRLQRAQQKRHALELGDAWKNPLGLVFTTETGAPHCDNRVRRVFQRAIKDAGVTRVRWHDLRHGAATLMLERNGGDLKAVSDAMGHSTITVTANSYVHVTQRVLAARTVSLLDDIVPVAKG